MAPSDGNIDPGFFLHDGRDLYFAPLPLRDVTGRRVGSLLVGVDLTVFIQRSRALMGGIAIASLILAAGLTAVFHRLLGRIEGRVHFSIEMLARANAELERVAFAATTQLHQPLQELANACRLLEERCPHGTESAAKTHLASVVRGADRIRETVAALEDYLDLSVTASRQAPVELTAVFAATLDEFRSALRGAKVSVGRLPAIPGNPVLMARAFFYLVEYALAAKSDDHPLHLSVNAEGGEGCWRLYFSHDGGDGGDAGEQTARLDLVARIAAWHGGKLVVVRNGDHSTTVQITLGIHS
jgi:signal transduction histidine kinase